MAKFSDNTSPNSGPWKKKHEFCVWDRGIWVVENPNLHIPLNVLLAAVASTPLLSCWKKDIFLGNDTEIADVTGFLQDNAQDLSALPSWESD